MKKAPLSEPFLLFFFVVCIILLFTENHIFNSLVFGGLNQHKYESMKVSMPIVVSVLVALIVFMFLQDWFTSKRLDPSTGKLTTSYFGFEG